MSAFLATFHTHYGAMAFQKYCGAQHMPARMMPVPRELSSSCGVCVRFEAERVPTIDRHEDMEACYTIDADGGYVETGG